MEFNGAFGLDNPYAGDVQAFPGGQSYTARHCYERSALFNLSTGTVGLAVFSGYLRLRTSQIYNDRILPNRSI